MKGRKKGWFIIGGIVVLIAIAVAFYSARTHDAKMYRSEQATIGDIENYYHFSGNIQAKMREDFTTPSSLEVKKVYVKVDDMVKKGDLLLKTEENEVRSTIDGKILSLRAEEGGVYPANTVLVTVMDPSTLYVQTMVDEYEQSTLKEGKDVKVTVNAPGKTYDGKVTFVSNEANRVEEVGYFSAEVSIPNDDELKIGMTAEIKALHQQAQDVITVTMDILQFDRSNHPYVYTKGEDGSMVQRKLTTGIQDGKRIEIKQGLSENEMVYKKIENWVGYEQETSKT